MGTLVVIWFHLSAIKLQIQPFPSPFPFTRLPKPIVHNPTPLANLIQTPLPARPLLLVPPLHLLEEVADQCSIQACSIDHLDPAC